MNAMLWLTLGIGIGGLAMAVAFVILFPYERHWRVVRKAERYLTACEEASKWCAMHAPVACVAEWIKEQGEDQPSMPVAAMRERVRALTEMEKHARSLFHKQETGVRS